MADACPFRSHILSLQAGRGSASHRYLGRLLILGTDTFLMIQGRFDYLDFMPLQRGF